VARSASAQSSASTPNDEPGPGSPGMADPPVIRCRENGPLVIHGPFRLVDHLGNEFALPTGKPNVALCRCGQSRSKPFCDGSHRQCGFQAAERAGDTGGVG
jgi:CDGSH-type Zn-finger protein